MDMMRSIYITHFLKSNTTYGAKEKLALQMRHSVVSASKDYLEIQPDFGEN